MRKSIALCLALLSLLAAGCATTGKTTSSRGDEMNSGVARVEVSGSTRMRGSVRTN